MISKEDRVVREQVALAIDSAIGEIYLPDWYGCEPRTEEHSKAERSLLDAIWAAISEWRRGGCNDE